MLLEVGESRSLGTDSEPWLRFGEEPKPDGAWAGRRLLMVNERPAFELSFWCGTCQFVFRRLDGANEGGSIQELQGRLLQGVHGLEEDVIQPFASVLPRGEYIPLLLRIQPRLVTPVLDGDYFAHEQVDTWGVDGFWGLPEYPRTPYYRTFETAVDQEAHLYEFVVPMVPPSWNDRDRVREIEAALAVTDKPTAVAVSLLDVCQPANKVGNDYYSHWALTHFLLDGHHKLEAAANTNRPLQLLTLLSVGDSLARTDQVARIPSLLAQPATSRNCI
jgi:hypothetical protein